MGDEEVEIRTTEKIPQAMSLFYLYNVKEYKFQILVVTGVLGSKKYFLL